MRVRSEFPLMSAGHQQHGAHFSGNRQSALFPFRARSVRGNFKQRPTYQIFNPFIFQQGDFRENLAKLKPDLQTNPCRIVKCTFAEYSKGYYYQEQCTEACLASIATLKAHAILSSRCALI